MIQKSPTQTLWTVKALYQNGVAITVREKYFSEARRKINYYAAVHNTKIQQVTGKRMSAEGSVYGSN